MRMSIKVMVASATALLSTVATAPASPARAVEDTAPVRVARDVSPAPKVVDLRVGEHRNFDRVVVDLDGRVPGHVVKYVRSLRYEGSGQAVPLKGRKFLSIALSPARAHDARGHSVYDGPQLRQYHLPALRGVAITGDFESQVSFGLSLRHRSDFRVFVLHAPNRIVIDVRH
ncbi:MAG: hypothetical protein WKF82_12960 [Nocardioidaceae bacterium]